MFIMRKLNYGHAPDSFFDEFGEDIRSLAYYLETHKIECFSYKIIGFAVLQSFVRTRSLETAFVLTSSKYEVF